MLVALEALHDEVGTPASTWRPTSLSPAPAREGERAGGPDRSPAQRSSVEPSLYPQQIAFNLIPQIDAFTDNGYTARR